MDNAALAAIFAEMAELMELKGENSFRIRAFARASEVIANLPQQAKSMLDAGTLTKVPGIGEGTAARIREIIETGTCADQQSLRAVVPPGLLEMLKLEGMGPKKVQLFYSELGVDSIEALEAAAQAGKIAPLPRMGEKTQEKILRAIEDHRRHLARMKLGEALPLGRQIVEKLRQVRGVRQVEVAGSTRRGRETVGDLDILASVEKKAVAAVMDTFISLPLVQEVMLRGETKCSVKLNNGRQTDLRVVEPTSFGAALHYFTGSQQHNIALRDRAKKRGWRLNEYGLLRESDDQVIASASEQEIFTALDLPWIAPELRENRGEIEAAEKGLLPHLIRADDLRGDLHMHTTDSDGRGSALAMARAARALGYKYLAITDHSAALSVAHGLDAGRLQEQMQQLERLNEELAGEITVLKGIEVDILVDGKLDLPLELLAELDWVVASIHSHFNLPAEKMNERIAAAMRTGVVDCLAHPTGRLLGQRDAYAVDLDQVINEAARWEVALELNAYPDRLDLDAVHCQQAREQNVPIVINTDAHAPEHLAVREYGILTARRGWLAKENVLNAGPLEVIAQRRQKRLRQLYKSTKIATKKSTRKRKLNA